MLWVAAFCLSQMMIMLMSFSCISGTGIRNVRQSCSKPGSVLRTKVKTSTAGDAANPEQLDCFIKLFAWVDITAVNSVYFNLWCLYSFLCVCVSCRHMRMRVRMRMCFSPRPLECFLMCFSADCSLLTAEGKNVWDFNNLTFFFISRLCGSSFQRICYISFFSCSKQYDQ